MRSDVKVGLICVFVLVLGFVVYFTMNRGDKPREGEVNNSSTPGILSANPNNGGGGVPLIAPPAASQPTTLAGPGGSTPDPMALVPASQPASQPTVRLTGPGEFGRPITTPIPLLPTTQPTTLAGGGTTTQPVIIIGGGAGIPGLGDNGLNVTPITPVLTPVTGASSEYVIKKGDLLVNVAKANRTTVAEILKLNPGLNPNRLSVNQKIKLPAPGTGLRSSTPTMPVTPTTPTTRPVTTATTRPTASGQPGGTYVVKKGDDLRKIALAVYGDKNMWEKIYRANRGTIKDPDTIRVGMTLKLPPKN